MPETPHGFGWLRDAPDIRDYFLDLPESSDAMSAEAVVMEKPLEQRAALSDVLTKITFPYPPPKESFRNVRFCSPVQDQGSLGSCTAQAGVGLLEYYQRRVHGKHVDASNRFVYKATRNLLGWTGDTGAFCRTTMAALAAFGAPPEHYLPYTTGPAFDDEPSAFLYSFAQNYQGLIYHRLDGVTTKLPLLVRIKMMLAIGWPLMFGFSVYQSIGQAGASGEVPFPAPQESRIGGHAVLAVGYDDDKVITNTNPHGPRTKGAILFKNSWGTDWGCVPPEHGTERGYGWLPYDYIVTSQAVDWWNLTKCEWLELGEFGL